VNRQAREWLDQIANRRLHSETRERPVDRFQPDALRCLPIITPDYRDTVEALVHKDMRLQFDGNRYCVPHRFAGRRLTLKADSSSVTIYDRVHEIVSYARSWRRGQTFGAERFEAELAEFRPAVRRSRAQDRLFAFLDGLCSKAALEAYLRDIADSDRSLSRQITELLELIRQYGPDAVAGAIEKAATARVFGADYVANILRQQQCPRREQPPLRLRDPRLNELVTDPLSLLAYDAFTCPKGWTLWDTRTKLRAAVLQNAQVLAASGNGCIPPNPNQQQDLTRHSLCSRWNKMLHNAPAQLAPLLQHLVPDFRV
jgi:hypothetical protein